MIEIFEKLPWYVQSAVKVGIIAIVAIIIERFVTRHLKRLIKKATLPIEVGSAFILIARFAVIAGTAIAVMEVGGLPTDWFTAFMALGGAAIGFASTRTIGNFIAGIYVLISRPFRVRDYIRVDGVEGVVEEITINYTKVRTPANTIVLISNQEILGKRITNFRFEGEEGVGYCYSFEVSFDHTVPTEKLHALFDKIVKKYEKYLFRKPEYGATAISRSERRYMFYLYFDEPEKIFTIQPQFLDEIIAAWDETRLKAV